MRIAAVIREGKAKKMMKNENLIELYGRLGI
jgi:hypothetical protein